MPGRSGGFDRQECARMALTPPQWACPNTTICDTPSVPTPYSSAARTLSPRPPPASQGGTRLATLRTVKTSPGPASQISAGSTRESLHPIIRTPGRCPAASRGMRFLPLRYSFFRKASAPSTSAAKLPVNRFASNAPMPPSGRARTGPVDRQVLPALPRKAGAPSISAVAARRSLMRPLVPTPRMLESYRGVQCRQRFSGDGEILRRIMKLYDFSPRRPAASAVFGGS